MLPGDPGLPAQTHADYFGKELAELLSSVAGELVSILDAGQTEDSSADRLSLYRDLVSHVRKMAHQEE